MNSVPIRNIKSNLYGHKEEIKNIFTMPIRNWKKVWNGFMTEL